MFLSHEAVANMLSSFENDASDMTLPCPLGGFSEVYNVYILHFIGYFMQYLSVKLVVYSSLYIDMSITLVVRSMDVTAIRCCFGENLQLVIVFVLSIQKNNTHLNTILPVRNLNKLYTNWMLFLYLAWVESKCTYFPIFLLTFHLRHPIY
jgi:hypothetical protein